MRGFCDIFRINIVQLTISCAEVTWTNQRTTAHTSTPRLRSPVLAHISAWKNEGRGSRFSLCQCYSSKRCFRVYRLWLFIQNHWAWTHISWIFCTMVSFLQRPANPVEITWNVRNLTSLTWNLSRSTNVNDFDKEDCDNTPSVLIL